MPPRNSSKTIVMALGGSIVYPEGIDSVFLSRFRKFILGFVKRKHKFVLVVGGGRAARLFQEAAGKVARVTEEDKDWLGIHATRLNAHLLRTIFREVADPIVIDSRHKLKKLEHPVTIASGWHPGWSTDYVAMALAEDFGTGEMIVAGKPDFVYDCDPRENGGAKPIPELSWQKYRRMIPKKWKPGFHSPVDPVAAALGEKAGIRAIVLDGRNLGNMKDFFLGRKFQGTVIK